MILTFLQLISGFTINYLFDPARLSIPFRDKLHWWVGRVTLLFSWAVAGTGISLYSTLIENADVALGVYIGYMVLVAGSFILFEFRLGQSHDLPKEHLSGADTRGDSPNTL